MNVALQLTNALKAAGVPVEVVSVGLPSDRATWRIVYPPTATQAQQTAGDALLASFQPSTQAEAAAVADGQWRGGDDTPMWDALLTHLPAMVQEITATGTIQRSLWRTRLRATMRSLLRAKG